MSHLLWAVQVTLQVTGAVSLTYWCFRLPFLLAERLDRRRVHLIEWALTRRGVPHSPQERMRQREGNQLNTVEQCREWASQVRTPGERVQLRRHLLKSEAGRAFMESEEGRDALAGA